MSDPVFLPVEHPLLTVGADVRSASRRYGDTDKPVGGAYLDTIVDHETGAIEYLVVDTHRGRPEWHLLDETDVDYTLYTGLVRRDVLADRMSVIAADLAKGRGRTARHHTAALVRLQAAIQ